ncbi:MAG: Electron transport complex protein RnfD [Candidatus Omnitrophica bacterium ADurb.Bin314]|nr:MAG: Electron transport complex protein RnfD [Candidatus Omnitrophica bacterium ADurb.Bin314]
MSRAISCLRASPPHIAASDSTTKRIWWKCAALVPVAITGILAGGMDFFRILMTSSAGAAAMEWLCGRSSGKKTTTTTGDAFLTGLTLAFLLPPGCPTAAILTGDFVAIVILQECFGGLGGRLFQPAVFARIFLDMIFPDRLEAPVLFGHANEPLVLGGILAGAAIFLSRRLIYFETPLWYLAISWMSALALGEMKDPERGFGITVFAAFFLITDTVTLPLTRKGANVFAILAAFLTAGLGLHYPAVAATGYAILITNLTVPWMNARLHPRPGEGS